MVQEGFRKFLWGFLFIMFDFRIQGFDILPDLIGFILFAVGFHTLADQSQYFVKGKAFNLVMVFISIFAVYEPPAQPAQDAGSIFPSPLGIAYGIAFGLASFILILIVVYHLFEGIKDMASRQQKFEIEREASQKWMYFLVFQIATVFTLVLFFIPPLFIAMILILLVWAIVLMILLMSFMNRCGEQL